MWVQMCVGEEHRGMWVQVCLASLVFVSNYFNVTVYL